MLSGDMFFCEQESLNRIKIGDTAIARKTGGGEMGGQPAAMKSS